MPNISKYNPYIGDFNSKITESSMHEPSNFYNLSGL